MGLALTSPHPRYPARHYTGKDNVTEAAEAGTPSGIDFAAINFYHSDPLARADIPEMTERVRELGQVCEEAMAL